MRVIVLGGGGMLGHKVWQRISAEFPASTVTLRGSTADHARTGIFPPERTVDGVDVRDFRRLEGVLDALRPEVLVNCCGITPRRQDAADVAACIEVNALLPHRLDRWAGRRGSRLITFSTDCVFDGTEGGCDEASPPSPRDVYGRTKLLGEVVEGNGLTLRTSFIGREIAHRTELLEWLLSNEGGMVRGFRGVLYTGVTTAFVASVVVKLIRERAELRGLYHLAGEAISKYELLRLARDAFRLDVEVVPDDTITLRHDLKGDRFREATGIVCPCWVELMDELSRDPTPYDRWKKGLRGCSMERPS